MTRRIQLIIIISSIAFTACATKRDAFVEANTHYYKGEYSQAAQKTKTLVRNERDRSLPLFQLTDGMVQYRLGNYNGGLPQLLSASENLERDLSSISTVADIARSGSRTHYRGFQHENVLARYYTGIGYFQMGDYENAIIAFRQALDRDVDKQDFRDQSYVILHFILGEAYLRIGDTDNALVAFRAAVNLDETFAPAWYKLASITHKLDRNQQSNEFYELYKTHNTSPQALAQDGSSPYIMLIIDMGFGPYMRGDMILGATSLYTRTNYPEKSVMIELNSDEHKAFAALDVYKEATSERRMTGEIARAGASALAREAASRIPVAGMFVSGPQADLRKWLTLPGEVAVALVPADEGIHNITLKFQDQTGKELKDFQQTHYYIPAAHELNNPLIVLRSKYRIQNQN